MRVRSIRVLLYRDKISEVTKDFIIKSNVTISFESYTVESSIFVGLKFLGFQISDKMVGI